MKHVIIETLDFEYSMTLRTVVISMLQTTLKVIFEICQRYNENNVSVVLSFQTWLEVSYITSLFEH